jgi:hypothetical protein
MAEGPPGNDELEAPDGCGRELAETEGLTDDALPMAVGGIEVDAITQDDACGCDVEFDDFDATPDDELPEAKGGVA